MIGLIYDYVPDIRLEEYSSILVLIVGAAIMIATSLAYEILPQHKEKRRLEHVRQYYQDRPASMLWDINHNIVDAAQAAILGIELATLSSHDCLNVNLSRGECTEKVTIGKKSLDQAKVDLSRLDRFFDELRDYVTRQS